MRVLVTALSGHGHLFPLVTTAWALRSAGHDVLFATAGDMTAVKTTGLQSYDVAPGLDMHGLLGGNAGKAFRSSTTGQPISETADPRDHPAFRMFNGLAEGMVDGLVALAKDWRPDVVVYEAMNLIGLLAAQAAGARSVSHSIGIAHNRRVLELFGAMQVDIFKRYGLDAIPEPDLHLDVAPPSMSMESYGWPMRYVPYNGGGQLPGWLTGRPERARIAVTLGTVAPMLTGVGPVERIAAAAEKIDAEFVVAIGANADTSSLTDLPDNVRLAGYVPLGPLLASSTAVIHHGGAGTTLTALDAGVPQIVVPQGADGPLNAAAVATAGCGLNVTDEELDAQLVERLLTDESLRSNADRVRVEMHGMPSPAEVTDRLTKYFGGQKS